MILFVISPGMNDLGCSLAGDGKVELILNHGIEVMGDGIVLVIVDAALSKYILLSANPERLSSTGR